MMLIGVMEWESLICIFCRVWVKVIVFGNWLLGFFVIVCLRSCCRLLGEFGCVREGSVVCLMCLIRLVLELCFFGCLNGEWFVSSV